MKILGIETSCDETAIAIIDINETEDGVLHVRVLANEILSQIELHRPYGGVFPNLAKREHEKNLKPILEQALKKAGFSGTKNPPVDLIAVTRGPGLEPCLWTGITFAEKLGKEWNIPVIPAHHMEGHILASLLSGEGMAEHSFTLTMPEFPALALLISGGHTELVLMRGVGEYQIVGKTRDDAVGECFDKTARILGLPYPGGPEISNLADMARKENLKLKTELPRPMIHSKDLDFSFSGLKTAVLYGTKGKTLSKDDIKEYAREIEESITDVIISKTGKAIEVHNAESLIVGGGVIANQFIRSALKRLTDSFDMPLYLPKAIHSTDNALMIALAGYFSRTEAKTGSLPLKAIGTVPLGPKI